MSTYFRPSRQGHKLEVRRKVLDSFDCSVQKLNIDCYFFFWIKIHYVCCGLVSKCSDTCWILVSPKKYTWVTFSIPLTFAFISVSNPSCPLPVSKSRPLTTCSLSEGGHCAASAERGRFVRAVMVEKVSWSGYPLIRALVIAQPVMPLAPGSSQFGVSQSRAVGNTHTKNQRMVSLLASHFFSPVPVGVPDKISIETAIKSAESRSASKVASRLKCGESGPSLAGSPGAVVP
jgi:hypothetical protein